jgi:hypothetical protein
MPAVFAGWLPCFKASVIAAFATHPIGQTKRWVTRGAGREFRLQAERPRKPNLRIYAVALAFDASSSSRRLASRGRHTGGLLARDRA